MMGRIKRKKDVEEEVWHIFFQIFLLQTVEDSGDLLILDKEEEEEGKEKCSISGTFCKLGSPLEPY